MPIVRLIRISKTSHIDYSSSQTMAENSQISKEPPNITQPLPVCLSQSKQDSSTKKLTEGKTTYSVKFSNQTTTSNLNSSIKEPSRISIKKHNTTNPTFSILNTTDFLNADSKDNLKTVELSCKNYKMSNPKSDETSDFVSADSEDSSTSKDGDSTEDSSSKDIISKTTTSSHESKVVVQVLSNVGSGTISALEHCIDESEVPIEIGNEKQFRMEEALDFLNQNKDQMQSPAIVNEERLKGKLRRTHLMNLHIRPGIGIRLNDIPYVASNVGNAPPALLSFLHKMMFGSYGKTKDEDALSQTRQDILHFSGFSFEENSETFQTKRKCLQKVPYQMLSAMCNVLLGKGPRTRYDSVEDLLYFLLKPTSNSTEKQTFSTQQKELLETELSGIEKEELKGSLPIVLVKKLDDSLVDKLLLGLKIDSSTLNKATMEKVIQKPKYTRVVGIPKCRIPLKSFPEVVSRVQNARRRIINLMHILLYGRPGSDEVNRLNILEFEGFSDNSEKNITRKSEFLKKLKIDELNQMCSIFSLRIKKSSKPEKVTKFLNCLQVADLVKRYKRGKTDVQQKQKEAISKKKKHNSERKMDSVQHIKKLKDFEKIRRNIECAPPEELIELSDLLFLMPCDSLEIHQRILDFSSSSFKENSPEFHSRRTLLYYMSPDIIKKIASILEITDWEEYTHPQDLASTLLRFLMEMKPPVSIHPNTKHSTNDLQRREPSVRMQRPHLMRLQKDDLHQRNSFSGSHPSHLALPDNAAIESFHEEKSPEDMSVVVRRITESSYSFTDLKSNEPVTVSDCKSEESLSLYSFIQHPSEKQLEMTVREIVSNNSWSSTMGEIINKVFQCYPKFNLTYRIDYIKSKAIEVLHELQFKNRT